jgi:hypothetical protein
MLGALAVSQTLYPGRLFAEAPSSSPVRLAWTAPPGCPSEEAVLREMQRILGGPTPRVATAKADVEELAPRRWSEHLSTDVDGVMGDRTLEADSCDGLAAATALILAWTIDPQRAADALLAPRAAGASLTPPIEQPEAAPPSQAGPQAPVPRPPPAAVTAVRPSQPTSTRARSRMTPQGVLAIEAVGDVGTLPSAGLAGRLSLGVLFGPMRFEAAFVDWLSEKAYATEPLSTQGTALHPIEGGLLGCFRWIPLRRMEVDPCLGGGLTYVTSNGFGETNQFSRATTWGSLYSDVVGAWIFAGRFGLRASLGVAVPFVRPEFDIQQAAKPSVFLHQASSVAGRATLGVEARFP